MLTTDCIEWDMAINAQGYGVKWRDGKLRRAHIEAYEWMYGSVPQGLELDHLCRNRACFNPDHLEAVTHHENILRGNLIGMGSHQRSKTACPSGHPYDDSNTYRSPTTGKRQCRTCLRERDVSRRLRMKEIS